MTQTSSTDSSALSRWQQWVLHARTTARWPASVAVLVAMAVYLALPSRYVAGPRLLVPILEAALLIPLSIYRPHRRADESAMQRIPSLAIIVIINAANLYSLALLIHRLLYGSIKGHTGAVELILSAAGIWLTTVIVFGLWYWEFDRGGPGARFHFPAKNPDFMFPQMDSPDQAPPGWTPGFVDYLYVSFTNALAFSPTDTMPLTEWAKLAMLVQSVASFLTIALVGARAVNILS